MYRMIFTALTIAIVSAGCGRSDKVKPEEIKVQEDTPLKQAEQHLQRYANGDALMSEAASFDYLVTEVRKTDPTRGEILATGFAELQKPRVNTRAKAKEILLQLAPKQTGG